MQAHAQMYHHYDDEEHHQEQQPTHQEQHRRRRQQQHLEQDRPHMETSEESSLDELAQDFSMPSESKQQKVKQKPVKLQKHLLQQLHGVSKDQPELQRRRQQRPTTVAPAPQQKAPLSQQQQEQQVPHLMMSGAAHQHLHRQPSLHQPSSPPLPLLPQQHCLVQSQAQTTRERLSPPEQRHRGKNTAALLEKDSAVQGTENHSRNASQAEIGASRPEASALASEMLVQDWSRMLSATQSLAAHPFGQCGGRAYTGRSPTLQDHGDALMEELIESLFTDELSITSQLHMVRDQSQLYPPLVSQLLLSQQVGACGRVSSIHDHATTRRCDDGDEGNGDECGSDVDFDDNVGAGAATAVCCDEGNDTRQSTSTASGESTSAACSHCPSLVSPTSRRAIHGTSQAEAFVPGGGLEESGFPPNVTAAEGQSPDGSTDSRLSTSDILQLGEELLMHV